MTVKSKLLKLISDPLGVLRNRINYFRSILRFKSKDSYRAEEYWQERHTKYGFDLRGVGAFDMTQEQNQQILDEGGRLMLGLCSRENINLKEVSMLDVGCGTGFYAGVFRNAGGKRYLGIDIVDVLFDGLRLRFPDFNFKKVDVSAQEIPGFYDLIIMMDVAQHITDERKFKYAMENIKKHLNPQGVIIISTSIGSYKRHSFYNVTRQLTTFEEMFRGYRISEPLPFCGNKMFSIKRID